VTPYHHQPEAQHPHSLAINKLPADYPIFGSQADICSATAHVRFTPNSDRESGFLQEVMSALPLKADM
jgi:hypothetical protein